MLSLSYQVTTTVNIYDGTIEKFRDIDTSQLQNFRTVIYTHDGLLSEASKGNRYAILFLQNLQKVYSKKYFYVNDWGYIHIADTVKELALLLNKSEEETRKSYLNQGLQRL